MWAEVWEVMVSTCRRRAKEELKGLCEPPKVNRKVKLGLDPGIKISKY